MAVNEPLEKAIGSPATMREIQSLEELGHDLRGCVCQGLDFQKGAIDWAGAQVEGAVFLGCHFEDPEESFELIRRGAVVFPRLTGLPYETHRTRLYGPRELLAQDERIYDHFVAQGGAHPDILESLAQRLHDHAMDDALGELIGERAHERLAHRIVGVMGGHAAPRSADPASPYGTAMQVGRALATRGYTVVTGGGPGCMEAANLGAALGLASDEEVRHALRELERAPRYTDDGYYRRALEVLDRHGDAIGRSLGIPTWFYGHEPFNVFATHIAKYFSNSLREDGLLTIALHGMIFTPGGAGTVQEIFQDACQNRYWTTGWRSPMVFLGSERWREVYDVAVAEAAGPEGHAAWLHLCDTPDEAIAFIDANPPARRSAR